ncbi:peptidoglycan-binding protein [Glutamicibacter sp. TV12E]|uniref:peptidoglycan-binding protein n=1 Tax=Glutamicibacter sp. TV12E TaxID=3446362 RepID=UPI0040348C35
MAISRNGWDVYTSSSNDKLTNFPWVTGRVRNGDHYTVLNYLADRYNKEVEKINRSSSWGYAYRAVRGASVVSEHATGTAVDFNAPEHPLGVSASRTFNATEIKAIRKIVKDLNGSVRWGGEWSRPDGMHFELIGGNALMKKTADRIKAGKKPKPIFTIPKPKPKDAPKEPSNKATDQDLKIQQRLKAMGLYKRSTDGVNGKYQQAAVKSFQKAHSLVQDGFWGPKTEAKYQDNVKLQRALNLMKSATPKLTVDGYLGKPTERRIADVLKRNAWSRRELKSKLKAVGAMK